MTRNVRMYNPTHRYDTTGESGPTDKPTVQWSYELDTNPQGIAVWDGQVYVGANKTISVFDTHGNPQWRFQTHGSVDSSPAVVDGTVYVGSSGKADSNLDVDNITNDRRCVRVHALDAASGNERWYFQIRGDGVLSPAVVDGTVYVGSNGTVYALDAASGTERWSFQPDEAMDSSPAVVDGTIYVGGLYGTVYALDTTSGTERWSFKTDGELQSSPAVVDGTVYVGDRYGTVYALDTTSGTERWSFKTDGKLQSSPAVVDGTVYLGGGRNNGIVYALDAAFGDEQWSFQTGGDVWSSPAVVDNTVYVGSGDGHVYALDAAFGDEQWSFQTGEGGVWSPVVKDGTVYVAGGDTMYALGNSNTGSGETEIFNKCSACHTELNDYDDPTFCPECGADLSDSGSETQIYDPD